MKKNIQFFMMIFALVLVASCNKIDEKATSEALIRFAPQSVETKAMINSETELRGKQTLAVYDLVQGETTPYIQNKIAYANGAWAYQIDPKEYPWKDGAHKFFSFTDGIGTLGSNNVLNVSKTLTTADADQVDILYSKIFSTTFAAWKADENNTSETPVPLEFGHLFSAVSFIVTNATTNQVILESADVQIPNKGSASVSFAGDATAVTYGDVTTDGAFITATPFEAQTIGQDVLLDVLTQGIVTEPLYQMVWPQSFDEDGDLTVSVKYSMTVAEGEPGGPWTSTFTKNVKIPKTEWKAGNKYVYTLKIYPSDIQLVFNVMPWDESEVGELNTEDGSINMSNVTWVNSKVTVGGEQVNTVVDGDYSVYMYHNPIVNGETYTANYGYFPAQGFFTVNYPKSGLFKIGLIPAVGESTVDASKYQIVIWDGTQYKAINPNGEPITNETVYFQVRAANSNPGAQKAQIDIWFKPDGSEEGWISAYSEIRANYALVIPN